jgi:NAD(P)-dependent dehydrogenase (short-subunit alcohol dehydrogenase family)
MSGHGWFDISGKAILVAGAGGGIGQVVARALKDEGALVVAADRDESSLTPLHNDGITCLTADICAQADLTRLFADHQLADGRCYAVVNAAGQLPIGTLERLDEATFRDCIDNNLTGAFLLSQHAQRAMRQSTVQGRIVHISSVSSQVANPGYAAYAASKAGLSHMIRVLGRELAPDGITVNGIGPALIETPLTSAYLADAAFRARAISDIPMGRLATAQDLIATLLLLLGPGGSFITGQTIYVDGGRTLV